MAGPCPAVEAIFTSPYNAGAWPVLQVGIVLLCVALQILERVGRLHFEAIRRSLGGVFGGVIEGAALGTILALAASGVGGEFIYFQF
jgi:hypothetical protein